MNSGETISAIACVLALTTALGRVFSLVSQLQLKINRLENENEVQNLWIEQTHEETHLRVDRLEHCLNKNTTNLLVGQKIG